MHWDKGGFMEVDRQAGGSGELIQDRFQSAHGCHIPFHDNQSIISVL